MRTDSLTHKASRTWVPLLLMLAVLTEQRTGSAQGQAARDTLLITPTTQGIFHLPETGITLEIAYASVNNPARVTVTHDAGSRYTIAAASAEGVPLTRFEMPLIVSAGRTESRLLGWPQTVDFAAAEAYTGSWLVVFDAHGLYALPASGPMLDAVLYLGPLEHYTPELLDIVPVNGFAATEPLERAILKTEPDGALTELPTAARSARYRDRFVPEDLRNPGGFMLMGAVRGSRLPDITRALRGTIPDDPDLPAPGALFAPVRLLLPFDCARDWVVSWGYHHSTPQNRFAVDFATDAAEQPVYAAHGGVVYLKRYGTPDHLIDIGVAARVVATDGVTSTVYGHLDEATTLAVWQLGKDTLPDFEWLEVGQAAPGAIVGVMGRTGYATGPHIHFVLWSWDQSFYQPVPLGPLTDFVRGQIIPGARRSDCDLYR